MTEETICPIMSRFDQYVYCTEGRIQPWMKCKCRAWVDGVYSIDGSKLIRGCYCKLIGE